MDSVCKLSKKKWILHEEKSRTAKVNDHLPLPCTTIKTV